MKYTCHIDINLPRDRVIELFDNPDNMKYWMEGLQSFEHISGTPGQPGAKSKLVFKMGKRHMEMIETITEKHPFEMAGTYDAKGVFNKIRIKFEEIRSDKTRYISEQEFEFQSIFMKIMGFLMPGAFKKQSKKYQEAFKKFAESQG